MSSTPEEQEAAWASIVENYGTVPEFPEGSDPVLGSGGIEIELPEPAPEGTGDVLDGPAELRHDPHAHYVPPPPPRLPFPRGLRGLAWVGVLGMPLLTLVLAMARVGLPTWAGLILLVWFLGGFGYLVATMGRGSSREGWDDGAVV